jgi:hypothetical protein
VSRSSRTFSWMLPNRAFFPRIRRVKATFYPERSLSAALFRDDAAHERLRSWLPGGWVLRKRADALEMLRVVGDDLLAGLEPFRPGWTLRRTRFWDGARHAVEHAAADDRQLSS